MSQDVFCARITKVLIPSFVFPEIYPRRSLARCCVPFVRHQTGSSTHPPNCCCGTATASSRSLPSSRWVATRDVHRANDATRGWKECARRKKKKEKHFHTNVGISALKQWWRLFLDISVITALKCVQMADLTPFSLHFCAFGVISYLYQVHTLWGKEIVWKKPKIKPTYLPDLRLFLLFMSFRDPRIAYAIKF